MNQAVVSRGVSRVSRGKVYASMCLVFLIVSGIYGYLFYTQTKIQPLAAVSSVMDPNAPPQFSRMIYGGFGPEALNKPMDVAEINQFIYVSDTNNRRVQVFDLGGTPLFTFGERGDKPGQFQFPYGIDGDSQGNVYVADLYNGSVSIFDQKGKFIKYFAEKNPEEKVLETPAGLRIIDDKVYVTDVTKGQVLVFDLQGQKLLEIGKTGTKAGELRAPNAVTADSEGNIYVVDTGNQRVQVFDKTGKFIRMFNGSKDGTGASIFVNPRGIAIDSRGIIYVISNLTHFIYGFDQEGQQLFEFGGNGSENDKFVLPNGLYINDNNQILITDTTNQRVAVWE